MSNASSQPFFFLALVWKLVLRVVWLLKNDTLVFRAEETEVWFAKNGGMDFGSKEVVAIVRSYV